MGLETVGGTHVPGLVISGCIEWTIPLCKETPFSTPCVEAVHPMDAEPAVPNYTQVTIPLAVVIQDKYTSFKSLCAGKSMLELFTRWPLK
jgi:hypothetical protein